MLGKEIRQSFVDYFAERAHRDVPSSSLVPAGDPTLLFTNAGMVQFKQVFQGLEKRDYKRAVTVQKCVRAGGKHNDLEQVGHTDRHHTFFEMLGNFSFGDYFKKEAIEYGWEWVTSNEYLGIDPDRIYVTVHHTDNDAANLWHSVTKIPTDRIYRLGDKDNFWQMGDTGPCGPCSEIFVDVRGERDPRGNGEAGKRVSGETGKRGSVLSQADFERLEEAGELLEIWNLVFMQFDQAADGSRSNLPAPSVDTGAGLERIAAVMQRVSSNFDTDLFMAIIDRAQDVIGVPYDRGPDGAGFRVLADHARAVSFLLADGVFPSSDGRGFVLRRILRRGVRHAYLMGRRDPTLAELSHVVVDTMGEAYPELRAKADHIERVTRAEEERFFETIEDGLKRIDQIMTGSRGTISGDEAFKLHDTFGFPLDLTQVIARERGWRVDTAGFAVALAVQQERSGDRVKGEGRRAKGEAPRAKAFTRVTPRKRQRFVGYEKTETETDVLAFRQSDDRLDLILHENPFYAESGGQVSDTGVVKGEGWELPVDDVLKVDGKQVITGPYEGAFEPTPVHAEVAEQRRRDIERNHTATHLVHAALRKVLGEHVTQKGSVVDPDRLRFDFSHHLPVSDHELREIEEEVNRHIWENIDVETRSMDYPDAIAAGAMALFGEKYGDRVRVVDIAEVSLELCGGTHCRTTGQIGLFHFGSEQGVASGVRRIEAVTGPGAYMFVKTLDERAEEVARALRTNPEHAAHKIEQILEEKRRLEKKVEELLKGGGQRADGEVDEHKLGDTTLIVGTAPVEDRGQIGLVMDSFREKNSNAIQVLFVGGDKAGIHVALTDDLISKGMKAGDIVNRIAAVSGGRGGGRPHFASAGAGDPAKLGAAREQTPAIVAELLGADAN